MSKLVETLEALLPNGEWKKFTLETNTVIQQWNSPVVIHDHYRHHYDYPWYTTLSNTPITYHSKSEERRITSMFKSGDTSLQLKSGVFNVEV